jgi:hypothetical protein
LCSPCLYCACPFFLSLCWFLLYMLVLRTDVYNRGWEETNCCLLACMFSWLRELLMTLPLILTATNAGEGAHRWRKRYWWLRMEPCYCKHELALLPCFSQKGTSREGQGWCCYCGTEKKFVGLGGRKKKDEGLSCNTGWKPIWWRLKGVLFCWVCEMGRWRGGSLSREWSLFSFFKGVGWLLVFF